MSAKFYQARLILCRHGQAQGNLNHEFLGHRDDSLTQLGLAQADHLAQRLAEEEIHSITTSPLIRARDTAHAVARVKNLSLIEDPRLKEQDFGDWEGYHFRGVSDHFPEDYQLWLENANIHPPTNGETLNAVVARVKSLLDELHLKDGQNPRTGGSWGLPAGAVVRCYGHPHPRHVALPISQRQHHRG